MSLIFSKTERIQPRVEHQHKEIGRRQTALKSQENQTRNSSRVDVLLLLQ